MHVASSGATNVANGVTAPLLDHRVPAAHSPPVRVQPLSVPLRRGNVNGNGNVNGMIHSRRLLVAHETGRIPNPAEVADRLAIFDVLAQHSRGVDRADEAILKSAYWPDAQVAYGGFNGNAYEFCAMLPGAISGFAHTHHVISNIAIAFEGIDARVETYVTANHYSAGTSASASTNASGGDREMAFFGRYLDRMQRRGDTWKILHRRVLMDWNQNVAATAVWHGPPFDGLARGDRHPEDPLYSHLSGK